MLTVMSARRLVLVAAVLLIMPLMSCEKTGAAIERDAICAGWQAIYVSERDKLTNGTAEQILAHNIFGQKQGCW